MTVPYVTVVPLYWNVTLPPQENTFDAGPPPAFVQTFPSKTWSSPSPGPQLEHQMSSPAGGLAMASLCAADMRGGRKPLVVELTSSCAAALGLVVPMPTWAFAGDTQD